MIHQILNGDLGTEQYIFQFDILIQGRSFPFNEQLIERLKVGSMASKVVGDLRLQIVFVEKFLIAFRINQTQLIAYRSKPLVGIVLSQQNAVFGSRSEHAIGILDTFRNQIVNEHTDVSLRTGQNQRIFFGKGEMCVDACHESLARRLLITGGSVHLSGKIKVSDNFRFERITQLHRVEIVILDGITRTVYLGLFQSRNQMESLHLNIFRKRGGKTVEVIFICVASLWFKEELVTCTVGETNNLIFYGRTITGTHTLDASLEHRGLFETLLEYLVYLLVGVGNPATELPVKRRCIGERKTSRRVFTGLLLHFGEIDSPSINANRGSGFEFFRNDATLFQLVGQNERSTLPYPTAGKINLPDMNTSVQKSTVSENDFL